MQSIFAFARGASRVLSRCLAATYVAPGLELLRTENPRVGGFDSLRGHFVGRQPRDFPYTDGWMFHVDAVRSPAPAYAASVFPNLPPIRIPPEERAHSGHGAHVLAQARCVGCVMGRTIR